MLMEIFDLTPFHVTLAASQLIKSCEYEHCAVILLVE